MLIHIVLFALGLFMLIKGGDWFVDGATGIAGRFHVPELLIGATVVSIGTTLPEVMVSATSAVEGHGAMAYGNAIGSVICNTSLILAISVAVRPAIINKKEMLTPVAFFFIAAGLYAGTAYITGYFSRVTGITLLAIFALYMVITVRQALKESQMKPDLTQPESPAADVQKEPSEPEKKEKKTKDTLLWYIVRLVLGAAVIAVGSRLLVNHGVAIAEILHVPETVIALTFVALGTSLPELVTAITSLIKGHGLLSVGNICGANLFNLVLVSGLSCTLGPFRISKPDFQTVMIGGREVFSALLVDTPLMFLVMLVMAVPALITGKLKRWQGILLLCLYAGFCIFTFTV